MSATDRPRRTLSLRQRTFAPALAIAIAIAVATLAGVQTLSRQHLAVRRLARAQAVSRLVVDVITSSARTDDLRRLMRKLDVEDEVDLVVVAVGNPPRVLASTRDEWDDRPLSIVGRPALTDQVSRTLRTGKENSVPLPDPNSISICTPFTGAANPDAPQGAVLVHFNARSLPIQIAAWERNVAILLAIGVLLAAIAAEWVLRRYVLAPIAAITAATQRRRSGEHDAKAPVFADDELGQLATTLNDMNRERDEAARHLEYQVFALDQAAIVSVADVDGNITYVNDRFCAMSGYAREELLGRNHRIVKSGHHPPEFFETMWATITSGKVWHGEVCNRARDGSLYWVSSTIIPSVDAAGRVDRYTGAFHDITARVREEQAAREGEMRTRLIVDSALDAVLAMDEAGHITAWNTEAERTFGWTAAEVMGRKLSEVIIPEQLRHAHERGLERFRRSGDGPMLGQRIEITALRRNADEFPAELAVTSLPGRDGTFFSAFVRDISRRKRAEAELVHAKDAAQQASRAKSEFLATMSHEIRTPMNGVIGFTDLLLDSPLQPAQREYAETIRNSGTSLLSLINDILDFSKIEAGRMEVDRTPFDARRTAAEVVELLGSRASDRRLGLVFDWPSDMPARLVGDAMRFRQVVTNLVGNALKFTESGAITLRAQRAGASALRVEVRDTGIGIAEDKLSTLFRKFTQADSSTTRRFGGTGLGLAISKQLVELMGGEIGAESKPGWGSTFWFTLPASGTDIATEPDAGQLDLAGMKILLVDELEVRCDVLASQLARWGFVPATASDGATALALLRQAAESAMPFDVAVLDLHAPVLDGEALGRLVLEDSGLGAPSLVLVRSGAPRSERESLMAQGFADVLLKPIVRPELLLPMLADIAASRRARTRHGGAPNAPAQSVAALPSEAAAAPAPGTPPVELATEPPFAGVRVLVAEDQPINQKLAVKVLARAGCVTDIAGNGIEACEMAERVEYDIVFMDCHMPRRDGFEATAAIRAREAAEQVAGRATRHMPIVALTASALDSDRDRCYASGMDDFISKPFRPDELHSALRRWAKPSGASEGPLREAA